MLYKEEIYLIKISILILSVLNSTMLYAQQGIWPVQNDDYSITQTYCGTYFNLHPAIDIHDYNKSTHSFNQNSKVVAARSGIVILVVDEDHEYWDYDVGKVVIIDVLNSEEFDVYVHLDEISFYYADYEEVSIERQAGQAIATGFDCATGKPHLHFSRLSSYVDNPNKPGYAPDYSNILNPFYLFGEQFDPHNNPPELLDTDNNGKLIIINQADQMLFSDVIMNQPIYGEVDILAEAHDKLMPTDFYEDDHPNNDYFHCPQGIFSIGYRIESKSENSSNVADLDNYLHLCQFDDFWFAEGGVDKGVDYIWDMDFNGNFYKKTRTPARSTKCQNH